VLSDVCSRLAVGFGAVADGVDDEGVLRFFGEADAVVADAEAKLFGVALQLLDVAFSGLGEAVEGGENAHGGGAVDAADIGAGRGRPVDQLHVFRSALEVFGGESELGQQLGVRDGLAGMCGEPSLGLGDGAAFVFALRFVVVRGVGDGAGDGIEHRLQQTDDGGDLAGGHAVDQFVGLFSGVQVWHRGVLFTRLSFGPASCFVLENHALQDGLDDVLLFGGEPGDGFKLELEGIVRSALVLGKK
jgi:hypothetical protein